MNLKTKASFIFSFVFLVTCISVLDDSEAKNTGYTTVPKVTPRHIAHVNSYKAFNESKQLSLIKLTLNRVDLQTKADMNFAQCNVESPNILTYQVRSIFFNANSKGTLTKNSTIVAKTYLNKDIDQMHIVLPELETLELKNFNNLPESISTITNTDNDSKVIGTEHVGYWQTVYSIESKQGKLLYRPKNKSRNCSYTLGPCGHHQLTVQALKDIGCKSLQCRKDRLNFKKSLSFSKKLLALNEKRLSKDGISKLKEYQKYLIHQQGAYGIKSIIAATSGKKILSNKLKRNMANNSPFSYKQLKKMSSKAAAKKFMNHWENKWVDEKILIVASQRTTSTDNLINPIFIPTFSDSELNLALNITF